MTVKCVNREEMELSIKRIKKIYEENKTLKLKLTKYKRAFEILKDKLELKVKINPSEYWLEYTEDYAHETLSVYLTKEEAELLEELMKGE